MGASDAFHDASYYFGNPVPPAPIHKGCCAAHADRLSDLIIQRFDATIAAVFYGFVFSVNIRTIGNSPKLTRTCSHTHKDQFEIAYSDYTNQGFSTATMMSYIAPALTPTSGNPTFR